MDRVARLREHLLLDAPGIEIGPLDRPIIPRSGTSVLYADHVSREGLAAKYADHGNVDKTAIPHIDVVLSEITLRDALGLGSMHYVLASHVIEHIPNPIAWLQELHDVLVDGGIVSLAIPDRRQCFDALRRESTAAEWIEAYLLVRDRPSPSRIFDAFSQEVTYNGEISWAQPVALNDLKLSRGPLHAYETARRILESGEYFDVHCWVFTPESFLNLMRTVTSTGLLRLKLKDVTATAGNEFFVKLQRDDACTKQQAVASFPAQGRRYDLLPSDFDATAYYRLNPDVADADVDPYEHYIDYGRHERRKFCDDVPNK